MRRFLSILLSVLIIFTLSGCQQPEEPKENPVSPPFFTARDESTGGVVYMLGSMHIGLPNTVYPEEIYSALDECKALACEVDIIALNENLNEVIDAMKVLECGSAAEMMGEDYEEIKNYFVEKGIYSPTLENYIPAMWSTMLTNKAVIDSGFSSDYGTEMVFLSYAKKKNYEIIELETAAEQYAVNAGMSPELQMYSLKSSIDMPYTMLLSQNTMLYNAWSTNNSGVLEMMLSTSDVPDEIAEDYANFAFEMYENRQKKMADFAVQSLKNGDKVMIMVGAAHYYATPDILDFLEEAGYSIEEPDLEQAA